MKLTNKNISEVIEKTEDILESEKVTQKNKTKVCLLLEEALLRYKEKYGEDAEFTFIANKRFFSKKILIKIRGEAYNPFEEKSEEEIFLNSLMTHLMNYEGADVAYRYESGFNEICATYAKEGKSFKIPGGNIAIAVLLALICSLFLQIFPLQTQKVVAEELVSPVLNTLFQVVLAVSVPFIFVNIVASICSVDDASSLNEITAKIMLSFAERLTICLIISFLIANLFFPAINLGFEDDVSMGTALDESSVLNLLLSIAPQNIIEPFLKGNILQIVILAAMLGFCILVLGNRANIVKGVILESRIIIFKMLSLVLKLMPLIVFLSVLKGFSAEFLSAGSKIFDVCKLLAAMYLSYAAVILITLLKNYIKHNINPIHFLKKIYPPCLITFTTGSGSASLPKNLEICKNELHIDGTLCNLYIHLSHALCATSRLIAMTVNLIFAANFFNVSFSVTQMVIAAFLSMQFALSSANESGGVMASVALLLTQFGFSLEVMSIIMIASIFCANASGVVGLIVRDADLYNLSLSEKKLRHERQQAKNL